MFAATRIGVMTSKAPSGMTLNIASNTQRPDIPVLAAAAGWDGAAPLVVNITAPLINTLNLPAHWVFPGGLTIDVSAATRIGGRSGGGAAVIARVPVKINNAGIISGGGGNGGTGQTVYVTSNLPATAYGGGGNGGSGQGFNTELGLLNATAGLSGSYNTAPNEGGAGVPAAWAQGGSGGFGGAWGQSGSAGGGGAWGNGTGGITTPAAAGGPAGHSVHGTDFVTWGATGTQIGPTHSGAYRYYRIVVDTLAAALSFVGFYEVELRATPGGADLTSPATPGLASTSFGPSNMPAHAVDNNIATYWAGAWSSGVWLQYDLGSAQIVRQLALTARSTAGTSPPASFRLLGSDNGTTFSEVAAFSGISGWADLQQRLFSI